MHLCRSKNRSEIGMRISVQLTVNWFQQIKAQAMMRCQTNIFPIFFLNRKFNETLANNKKKSTEKAKHI